MLCDFETPRTATGLGSFPVAVEGVTRQLPVVTHVEFPSIMFVDPELLVITELPITTLLFEPELPTVMLADFPNVGLKFEGTKFPEKEGMLGNLATVEFTVKEVLLLNVIAAGFEAGTIKTFEVVVEFPVVIVEFLIPTLTNFGRK